MNIVAVIHAKLESERVPYKNLRCIGGIPLVAHSVIKAVRSEVFSDVVIDSDSDEIIDIGYSYGATKHIIQPQGGFSSPHHLIYHQYRDLCDSDGVIDYDAIAQIVPTSPFIRTESIQNAVKLFDSGLKNSLLAVYSDKFYLLDSVTKKPLYTDLKFQINVPGTEIQSYYVPHSQDLQKTYIETTGMYITKCDYIKRRMQRVDWDSFYIYELDKVESIDINDETDFELAKALARGLRDYAPKR